MDSFFSFSEQFIDVTQPQQNFNHVNSLYKHLLTQRTLPKVGWNDSQIEHFLSLISQMDTNNFDTNVGIGEREGRIFSPLVSKRNYYLSHGIGRSGNLLDTQPKAAGCSLLHALTDPLVLHAIKLAGGVSIKKAMFVPMCTGMTLSLVMTYLACENRASKKKGKYVVWSRIDQKSCFKSIFDAGLEPIILEQIYQRDIKYDEKSTKQCGVHSDNYDALTTDLVLLEKHLSERGDEIVCVLSTTSCFAPRLPDRIIEIAKLCEKYKVPHVINNAYGIQSRKIMAQISTACQSGRIDAIVQSTDKNFLVPVGGAIISGPKSDILDQIGKFYSGRGAISNLIDLFITLVSMGETGWLKILKEREDLVEYFEVSIEKAAKSHGEKLLKTKRNDISFTMTLDQFKNPTEIGSKLFYRNVSGPRVVARSDKSNSIKIIENPLYEWKFKGFGAHTDDYPHSYLTMACAIGITKEEIDQFFDRLNTILTKSEKVKISQEHVE
jgi:O-phospho-L-seryl-tRNASec:L-selenocysteinyl-tRNA synthase